MTRPMAEFYDRFLAGFRWMARQTCIITRLATSSLRRFFHFRTYWQTTAIPTTATPEPCPVELKQLPPHS